jgi:hypothetical protein
MLAKQMPASVTRQRARPPTRGQNRQKAYSRSEQAQPTTPLKPLSDAEKAEMRVLQGQLEALQTPGSKLTFKEVPYEDQVESSETYGRTLLKAGEVLLKESSYHGYSSESPKNSEVNFGLEVAPPRGCQIVPYILKGAVVATHSWVVMVSRNISYFCTSATALP